MRLVIFSLVCGIVVCGSVVFLTLSNSHEDWMRHNKCVVCKPSGKLAMWGECE